MKGLSIIILGMLNVFLCISGSTNEVTKPELPGTEIYETDLSTCSNSECTSESDIEEITEASSFIQTDNTILKTTTISNKKPNDVQKKNETVENQLQDKNSKDNTQKTTQEAKSKPQQISKPKVKPNTKPNKKQPQNNTLTNSTKSVELSKTKAKSLQTLKSCNCDITKGICEINCCCDEDCTKDDKKAFSQCEDEASYISRSDYCFAPNVIYRNNTPYRTFNLRPGLLCIARNNLPDKIKYYTHKVLKTEETVTKMLKRRNTYHWKIKSTDIDSELVSNKPYIHGFPVWIFKNTSDESTFHKLTIPHEGMSSMCGSQYIVGFLEDTVSSCLVKGPKSQIDCEDFNRLNFELYKDLHVLISPRLLNLSADLEEIYLDEILIKAQMFICSNGKCKEALNSHSPKYDGESKTCKDIIKRVNFHIKHNGTEGIVKVDSFIHLENVEIGREMIRKQFEVKFSWIKTDKKSFSRSGKPGYLSRKPLITGNKTEKGEAEVKREIFLFSYEPNSWLTIATTSGNGFCSDKRNNILFNENIRAECTMLIRNEDMDTAENCSTLHEQIQRYLYGRSENMEDTWISSWGDPRQEDASAWVPLVYTTQQSMPSCHQLTTAISYHFLYSLSGPLGSPQAKLIGAILETVSSPFMCESPPCLIKITTAVTFTSDTSIPRLSYPKHPALRLHLPKDFFYPFSSSSANLLYYNTCVILIFCTVPFFIL